MEKEKLNIYQKLVEVRKKVPYLQKQAQGYQYNYVASSQVVGALRDELDKQGLLLISKVIKSKVNTLQQQVQDKNGTKIKQTFFTELDIEFEWVNTEDPSERFTVPFYSQGLDYDGEKGVGKALTYAEKYFLLKSFNIPTDQDDPDSFQRKSDTFTPNYISLEQVNELADYVEELSRLRQVPGASFIQQLGFDTLEKVQVSQYISVRQTLLGWLGEAKGTVQGQQNTWIDQPKQQSQVQHNVFSDTVTIRNISVDYNQHTPFVRFDVTGNGEYTIFSRNPQDAQKVQIGQQIYVEYVQEQGFYFVVKIEVIQQQSQAKFQPQFDSTQQQQSTKLIEGTINSIGNVSNTPNNGQPYTTVVLNTNEGQKNILVRGLNAVQEVLNMAIGQNVVFETTEESGFLIYVGLGSVSDHAS